MLCFIIFTFLISSVASTDISEYDGAELLGDYNLLYVWPKPIELVPNCTYARYRNMHFQNIPISCECGRDEPSLAVLYQETRFLPVSVLFDIVTNFDEAARALTDSCQCHPLDNNRIVVMKINDDLMLQFEREEVLRHYLFGKRILSEDELRSIIMTFEGLKYEDGQLVCEEY